MCAVQVGYLWKFNLLIEDSEALSQELSSACSTSLLRSSIDADPSRWFAVYTVSRDEKRVLEYFEEREIESYLPLHRSMRRWNNGCTVNVDLPLFANYVF